MKKQDFIKAVALASGLSQDTTSKVLNSMVDLITTELKADRDVTLTGFGTFKLSKRAPRTGVNPRTGAKISIPAMSTPSFKAGKTFKESIR
jgi:DNA-binding protein HU-beta